MHIPADSIVDYVNKIPEERQRTFHEILNVFRSNLPKGFEEGLSYGMPSFSVPHSIYPAGYHCKPEIPLPFISIASQKNFIALYHMGIYAMPDLYAWWVSEFPKHSKKKLDMGKSCVRFKKVEDVPLELIAELAQKVTPIQWVNAYESAFRK
jgi:hypothetical protein